MGFFSWFSKSDSKDYESLLARLATEINEAKTHLSEVRLRERRVSLLFNAYAVGVWAVWTGLWWIGRLPWGLIGWPSDGVEARSVGASGVVAGPVFIWFLNRIIGFFFTRIRTSEETHLRLLLTKQRKQLDDIKKATNYDSTRELIERYDEASRGQPGQPRPPMALPSNPSTPVRKVPHSSSPQAAAAPQLNTPRAPGHLVGVAGTPSHTPSTPVPVPQGMSAEQAAILQMQMQAIQPVLPTPEKKWYDRLADSILGDDPAQSTSNKYALICGECFGHSGLVGSKYEWERMKWICPRCNHLNPSPLSREQPAVEQVTETPLKSLPSPVTPTQHLSRASPRPRRQLGERATPRSSRLGQEMFSASTEDNIDDANECDESMEVDT